MNILLYILLGALALALLLILMSVIFSLVLIFTSFTRAKNADEAVKLSKEYIRSTLGEEKYLPISEGDAWLAEHKFEEHYITSRDGLRLCAHIYRNEKPMGRTAVLVHGYRSLPYFDFCGIMKFYYDNGFDIVLPFHRTHGKSEGRFITFGKLERYDIVDWVKYANSLLGEQPTLINGISMGCTTTLLAAALSDMPENIRFVIADCGYITPRAIFTDVLRSRFHLPSFPIIPIASVLCKWICGFGFDDFSTLDAVRSLPCPALFIHGEADDFVYIYNTRQNYDACTSDKTLITVPGAGHGLAYINDRERLGGEMRGVIERYF